MAGILRRLAAEPALIGGVVASVLPALVALHVISLDERSIGVVVVAVNAIVAALVRPLVSPSAAGSPQGVAAATEGANG